MGRYLNTGTEVDRLRDLCKLAGSERVERTPVSDQPPRTSFSKLKPAQCDEIIRRYQAGDRPVDIARDFGVTGWTIQNVRKRSGVATRGRSMSQDEIDRAAKLKAAGTSLRKIAVAVGYDARTVTKELRARDISIEPTLDGAGSTDRLRRA
jgi:hypothetical protein